MSAPAPFVRDHRFIRDHAGRVRIFHGVNLSGRSKMPPFLPLTDPAPLDTLQAWGFNIVRLLVMWEALEPERGLVDEVYMRSVSTLIEQAAARGLSVIVDVHQDLYARVHGGDGAPAWAVRHRGRPARGTKWFLDYGLSLAVQRSFADFWANEDGLLDAYMKTMRALVRGMNRHPNVVGYDFFNEPMTALPAVLDGRFERETLRDFHAACARLLHEEAADQTPRLHFIEPTPIVAFGVPCRLQHEYGPTAVFAPHLYDVAAIGSGRYRRGLSTAPAAIGQTAKWAERHAMPLMFGEFGALNGVVDAKQMLDDQCRLMDRHFASWTAWHFDPSGEDWNDEGASIVEPGGGERPFTAALVRPYPRAIAGRPTHWESGSDRPWTLKYIASEGTTEVCVPARWCAAPTAETRNAQAQWNDPRDVLQVQARPGAAVTIVLHRDG